MPNLHVWSAKTISTQPPPGRSAVVRFADTEDLLAPIYDRENAALTLDCVFADLSHDDAGLRAPTAGDAARIVTFCEHAAESGIENLVCQCQAGIGRSVALAMALGRKSGVRVEFRGTHNRRLYKLLCEQLELPAEREPLVSLAVRVKYDLEHLTAFILSLRRQRHSNWEAVCITDGWDGKTDVRGHLPEDDRVRIIKTTRTHGHWGHPYRQAALEACRGEWIGTNNDDNYLTPGYLEQMVHVGEESQADLVLCGAVHRYSGWSTCKVGGDLACWLARRELVAKCRWDDYGFEGDQSYLDQLVKHAGPRVAEIRKPLVVKN